MKAGKVVTAAQAAALVKDGDCITTSGFVGIGVPDELLVAIEERFVDTGHPRDLSLVFAAGQGDGKDRGLNRLGHEGLLKRVVGGHWGLIPKVAKLATMGKIQGWNLPQGVISQLYRDIAAGKPGLLSSVGLETFVDPRQGGGAINDISTEPQVELMEIGGEETLFYPSQHLTVALLRGTTADEAGNVTMEREALTIDPAEMDLRTDLLHLDLPDRVALEPNLGQLFLNFEKMRIRTRDEVTRVQTTVAKTCAAYGKPVDVIVNYDGFRIDEALESNWAEMVTGLSDRYYRNVSRYSGSAFMRMKLGRVFPDARTHIFETGAQARAFLGANHTA